MIRPQTTAALARALLALFAFVQLSPLGLSWCQTGDGSLHVGCCCGFCQCADACEDRTPDAQSGVNQRCPDCGHQLAAASLAALPGPSLCAQCCEHVQMQYASQHGVLRSPPRTVQAALTVVLPLAATCHGGLLARARGVPQTHAPPGSAACPAASGAARLPLRI